MRAGRQQPGEVDAALRAALGEPTLAVTFDGPDGLVDRDGTPVALAPSAGRVRGVVATGGHDVAVIDLLEALVAEHPRLLTAVLSAAALPMDNAALHARAATRGGFAIDGGEPVVKPRAGRAEANLRRDQIGECASLALPRLRRRWPRWSASDRVVAHCPHRRSRLGLAVG